MSEGLTTRLDTMRHLRELVDLDTDEEVVVTLAAPKNVTSRAIWIHEVQGDAEYPVVGGRFFDDNYRITFAMRDGRSGLSAGEALEGASLLLEQSVRVFAESTRLSGSVHSIEITQVDGPDATPDTSGYIGTASVVLLIKARRRPTA